MLRTAAYLVSIFGVIFGGAYALDKLAKHKEEMIEKQEADEVELDDFVEEDVCEDFLWYDEMWNEVMVDFNKCCGCRPKCHKQDTDGDRECCDQCHCNEEENKCCGNCKCDQDNEE